MVETTCVYEWRMQSRPHYVPKLVREVLERLDTARLTREEHGDIRVMLSELMFNAVLHGNRLDENKLVHVNLRVEDAAIRISITDEGEGFNAAETLTNAVQYREERLTKESGRGLAIVAALADYMEFSLDGRQVTVVKRVGS